MKVLVLVFAAFLSAHAGNQKASEKEDIGTLLAAAQAHLASGKLKEALHAADKALILAPRSAKAHALRGLLRLRAGQAKAALTDLQRSTWLKNDMPVAYFGQGLAYRALGDEQAATRALNFACGLSDMFCGQNKLGPDSELLHRLDQTSAGDRLCACCDAYNKDKLHRDDLIRRDLEKRKTRQERSLGQFKVFVDFSFEDRLIESGIGFQHEVVDDAGIVYKPVHYDHGNGIAVADVDGDGLLDIYYTTQIGPNQLWRNKGDGLFEDITALAGIALADRIGVSASFADIDNDGDPDLFATTVRMGNALFENLGGGRFRDITQASGLTYSGHSSGATFFDYDNDGLLDLFLANVGVYTVDEQGRGSYQIGMPDAFAGHLKPERHERSTLYRNLGGLRFADVSEQVGLIENGFTGDASFCDVDRDGWPDLYALNMQGNDRLWRNKAGKAFDDKTAQYFPKTPWGSMGIKFFDFDNDGNTDLYITDMHSDMSAPVPVRKEKRKSDMQWPDEFLQGGADNIFGNAFYHSDGKGFRERSDEFLLENYWPWGLSAGDLNADGYDDLFVASSMNYPFPYAINSLFLNNAGQGFLDSEFLLGVEPRDVLIKPWFTLDCSGSDRENPYCRGKKGRQVVWGTYGSRSSVLFDYDGDGDLDILTNEFHSQPLVLRSNLSDKKKLAYLRVHLQGTSSNRDGLGARVTVTAAGKTWYKTHDGKSGYLSQSAKPLYFGLGDADSVTAVEVHWPSGKKQVVSKGLKLNQTLKIKEPK